MIKPRNVRQNAIKVGPISSVPSSLTKTAAKEMQNAPKDSRSKLVAGLTDEVLFIRQDNVAISGCQLITGRIEF